MKRFFKRLFKKKEQQVLEVKKDIKEVKEVNEVKEVPEIMTTEDKTKKQKKESYVEKEVNDMVIIKKGNFAPILVPIDAKAIIDEEYNG